MILPKNLLSDTYRAPSIFLCQTNKDKIGELNVSDFNGTFKWNAYSEISFSIDRKYCDINSGETIINKYYDLIEGLRLVYVEGFGYFQLLNPEIESDGIKETKHMSAYSLEYDLSNRYLETFIINKGVAGSIDGVRLYDQVDTSHSLLHLVIAEKAPDWTIGHVDANLATQRRFFEIDRESVYDFLMNDLCETFKCVVVFNTINNTINIYEEETAGAETDVLITFENLAKNIKVNSSTDDIKTVLTVTGADDINIRDVNYGLPYITDLSYYHTVEWMGQHLYDAYNDYMQVVASHEQLYLEKKTEAQRLTDIINDLKNRVGENLTSTKIEDFFDFLISFYQTGSVDQEKMSTLDTDFMYLNASLWNMFKSTMNNPLSSAAQREDAISNVLNTILDEYGLNNLKIYESGYKEMQTTMASNGMSEPSNNEYYQYHAAYMMLNSIQNDIAQRNAAITSAQTSLDVVNAEINTIVADVSINNHLNTEDLVRLAPFLREDEYNDDNFVVVDSDTTQDIMDTKTALLNAGVTELHKLSQPKLSFSTSIINLFALEEFARIANQFQLGNMINIEIRDGYIKKSRLMEVSLNFSDLSDFNVTFGDLLSIRSEADIHADLLSRAINAGKSVSKNASGWQKGTDQINEIQQNINQGLLDAATEIKSIHGTQSTTLDRYGIHLQKVENGVVDKEQGWIVSNKFLYTDDNWKTTKSLFGKFLYNGEERWGVLSDALVGGYVQGTEIEGGSLRIGNRGDGTYALVVNSDGTVQINAWGGELNDKIVSIEENSYTVVVDASTTPIFDESVQTTVLTCRIYQNYQEVSPIPAGATFTWRRVSSDAAGDTTWNGSHANLTTNTITITGEDVEHSAQFSCEVNIP